MSSEKILNEKKAVVSGLADEFKSAQTIVLAEYLGLTVAQDTELRNTLRSAGVTYKVVKNTMGILAAKEAGLEGLEEVFKGSTAIAYSDTDVIAPAKLLKKFVKDHPDYKIKGGVSAGRVLSYDELMALADIPELPVLYGKLVGSLVSPISGLAMMVKAIADKVTEVGGSTGADAAVGAEVVVSEAKAAEPVAEADSAEPEVQAEPVVEAEPEAEAKNEEAAPEAPAEEATEVKEEAPAQSAE